MDIDLVHMRRLDTTLLIVFVEVMRQRKLTVVAERLGLTQSAVSHSLKRLRDVFSDELFIRRPNGVEPTQRALDLEPQVQAILDLTRATIAGRAFDPATANGVVRIAAPDYHATLLAGPLIEKVRAQAPGLQLSFRPLVRNQALDALSSGDVDLALGFFRRLPEGYLSRLLFEDGYVVIARKGHPNIGRRLTLKRYAEADHVLVSFDGTLSGIVDHALAELGLKRRVLAAVPFFFSAFAAVSQSDLIATIPDRVAAAFAGPFQLQMSKPPVQLRPYQVSVVWHRRNATSLLHEWIVGLVGEYRAGTERR